VAATETRLPYAAAYAVAQRLLDEISDCCDAAIIAGSIRRGEPTCGDVEIVAVPAVELRHERDLFGQVVKTVPNDRLAARLTTLADNAVIRRRPRADGKLVWGPSWKSFTFEDTAIDLSTP
jgi:DNA polymerase beta palm